MSGDSDGIPGIAVGIAATGLVLVAAALRNETPTDTLRRVLGRPTSGQSISTALGSVASNIRDPLAAAAGVAAHGVAGIATNASGLVQAAEKYLGVKYVYGGTSKNGIDCSGLVVASLRDVGVKGVPRFTTVTFDAWAKGQGATRLTPADFSAGDVLRRPGHMAIAVSNTRMIHAPHVGAVVTEADIYSKPSWWGWRLRP